MKKLKIKSNKPVTSVRPKKPGSRLHVGTAVFILLLTAIMGITTLRFGLAATPGTGDIAIDIKDSVSGAPVSDIIVYLDRYNEETGPCDRTYSNSNQYGEAIFYNCTVYMPGVYFISDMNLTARGYKVNPGSQKAIGGQVTTVVNAHAIWNVNVSPIDTDNDGTPDNTAGYVPDRCPNVSGPANNYGCPVVVTPPASTPIITPPSTPAAPTPSTSQVTKPATVKKATTITSKPSTAIPTPAVVTSTTGDKTPPSAPGDLTIDLNDTTNFLSWIDASDNVGVVGYNIERSTDQKQWDPIAEKATDTFYTDQDLTAGKHYYYRVRAVDAAGNLSEGAMADIAIPKSNAKKAVSPATKKASTSSVVPITAGILLLLISAFAAFWLFRRHSLAPDDDYSYDVALPPPPADNATVYTPDQPAEHTSVSLRDMVIEDMHNHQNPPLPPPPQPPLPPAPSQP